MPMVCHTIVIIPAHSGYEESFMRSSLLRLVISKSCFSSCAQSQNKNKGSNKGKLQSIFDTRSKCNLYKLKNPNMDIKAFSICLFIQHNIFKTVVSEIYFNVLVNKIINKCLQDHKRKSIITVTQILPLQFLANYEILKHIALVCRNVLAQGKNCYTFHSTA